MRRTLFLLPNIFFILLFGCQSAKIQNHQEEPLTSSKEQALDLELENKLKSSFGFYSNAALEKNLNQKLELLIKANLKESKSVLVLPKIKLLNSKNKILATGFKNNIYLAKGLISIAKYDNEISFLLAIALVALNEELTSKRFLEINKNASSLSKNWFKPQGLFDYGKKNLLDVMKQSIALSYSSNFDPRGSITLSRRWTENADYPEIFPEKEDVLELTRNEVSKLVPLKDPIIRTVAYEEILKTLK